MKHKFFSILSMLAIITLILPSGSTALSARLAGDETPYIDSDTMVMLPIVMRDFSMLPPYEPANPSPIDGAIDQSIEANLSWTGGDPDGDTVTYDVYFEAENANPGVLVSNDQLSTTLDPGTLSYSTLYYWRIIAKDEHDTITIGPVWNFTTGVLHSNVLYIPSGEFQMGCDPDHNATAPCVLNQLPLHTVYLDAYNIDATEVTNAQYAECVMAGVCTPPAYYSSSTRSSYYDNQYFANFPVIYITWDNANTYCRWKGGHLPTEAEWEKAARGSIDTRPFPWGDWVLSNVCSYANVYYYSSDSQSWQDCVGDTDQVGIRPLGDSPYGVLDMSGNVFEWVNDWYQEDYYTYSPLENPPGPESGETKIARGGGFHT